MATALFKVEPDPDESCMGWALRVAEANFLMSPWHVFRAAGVQPLYVGILRFDAEKLARFVGVDERQLQAIGCADTSRRAARVVFRGHVVSRSRVRNWTPQFCPQCVAERGLARGVWDLHLVSACTRHRLLLVDRCPGCARRVSWYRPTVGVCKCGTALGTAARRPASDADVAVSAAIEAALTGSVDAWTACFGTANAAVTRWAATPLNHVLVSIRELARLADDVSARTPICERTRIVQGAGPVILGWPQSFPTCLDGWVQRRAARTVMRARNGGEVGAVQIINAERRVVRMMAKANDVRDDLLDLEFLRHIATLAPCSIEPRTARYMASVGIDPEWISITEAARKLGTTRGTVQSLIERKLLVTRGDPDDPTRVPRIARDSLRPELAVHPVVNARGAGALLGLPVQLLKELRASGELAHSNRGVRPKSFAMEDVTDFVERWARIRVRRPPAGTPLVTLQEAIHQGYARSHLGWKAELVRQILQGRVPAYAISASPQLDATISRVDLLAVKAEFLKADLSLGDAAIALALPCLGVIQLIAAGRMRADFHDDKVRIKLSAVRAFGATHIRLSALERILRPTAPLEDLCRARGVEVLSVECGGGRCSFVARADARRLCAPARLR